MWMEPHFLAQSVLVTSPMLPGPVGEDVGTDGSDYWHAPPLVCNLTCRDHPCPCRYGRGLGSRGVCGGKSREQQGEVLQ